MTTILACVATAVISIVTLPPLQQAAERWAYMRDREK